VAARLRPSPQDSVAGVWWRETVSGTLIVSWPHRAAVALGIVVLTLVPGAADARVVTGTSDIRTAGPAPSESSAEVRLDPLDLACDGPAVTTVRAPGRNWRTAVVDPIRRLPTDWIPADLVEIPDLGYRGTEVATVRAVVEDDLRAMHAAALAAHAPFIVVSAFRSEAQQAVLWRAEAERAATRTTDRSHADGDATGETGQASDPGPTAVPTQTPTPNPSMTTGGPRAVATTDPTPTTDPTSTAGPTTPRPSADNAASTTAPDPTGTPDPTATTAPDATATPTSPAGTNDETPADVTAPGTARPGHSEHQLGTTIDVVDPSLPDLVPGLSDTPAGTWLAAHAAEYGFVVSYPDGASDRTCFKPEPWHLRYVGVSTARSMAANDLSPREFLLTR